MNSNVWTLFKNYRNFVSTFFVSKFELSPRSRILSPNAKQQNLDEEKLFRTLSLTTSRVSIVAWQSRGEREQLHTHRSVVRLKVCLVSSRVSLFFRLPRRKNSSVTRKPTEKRCKIPAETSATTSARGRNRVPAESDRIGGHSVVYLFLSRIASMEVVGQQALVAGRVSVEEPGWP